MPTEIGTTKTLGPPKIPVTGVSYHFPLHRRSHIHPIVDISKHKNLKNPYELKIERGTCTCSLLLTHDSHVLGLSTKELLAETAKSEASEGRVDPGLAVLDAVYEGVELQSIR